jgi:SHS family lactate transporter-like MFS transporter
MGSIAWFSLFAFLSGLVPSYWMLLVCRILFGLGMGGEWAAGMPLVLEHFPEHRRGFVLGVLQGAFSWGVILAAAAFEFLTPWLTGGPVAPWRVLLWTGVVPALLVLWIRRHVPESPVWLSRQTRAASSVSLPSVLRLEVILAVGCLACCMLMYQSMTFWHATLLRARELPTLPYVAAINIGGIVGAAMWGRLGDTRLGHRRGLALGAFLAVLITPAFVAADSRVELFIGALVIGATGAGVIGIAPSFIGRLFDESARAAGWGLVYHLAVAIGAVAPYALGRMQDAGTALPTAMAIGIIGPGLLAVVFALVRPRPPRSLRSVSKQTKKR